MACRVEARFVRRFPGGPSIEAVLAFGGSGGEVTVLFGPSGSGKTTILRVLAGLDRPDEGTVTADGEVWADVATGAFVPAQLRRIGVVFQEGALFPHLTAEGNVAYGLHRLPGAERTRRVSEALSRVGLGGFEGRRPSELSGGQRQRVALARALAPSPRLLLLDEPLSDLDATARTALQRELRTLLLSTATTALVVTHDRTEALSLGDRLAIVVDGSVRQVGPIEEVFSRPADLAAARVTGVETVVPGRIAKDGSGLVLVEVGTARVAAALPADDGARDVFCCIRGEDVILLRGEVPILSARNHLAARVTAVTPQGPLVRIELDAGFPLVALVTRPAVEELGLAPGEAVTAAFKAPSVHLIARGS